MNSFPLSLLFTVLALALVLVLAWFTIRLLARLGGGKLGSSRIKVTHTCPLNAREKLLLVEYDNHEYFLGVTAHGISVLDKKSAPLAATGSVQAQA